MGDQVQQYPLADLIKEYGDTDFTSNALAIGTQVKTAVLTVGAGKTYTATLPAAQKWAFQHRSVFVRTLGAASSVTLAVANAENWSNQTLDEALDQVVLYSDGVTARIVYSNLS